MNVIGLFIPKIISLLMIWIPTYDIKYKLVLFVIWTIKLLIDYSVSQPGHRGRIYKITSSVSFEFGELIITLFQLAPAVVFLIFSLYAKTWMPCLVGSITVTLLFFQLIQDIMEVIKKDRS